MKPQTSWTGLWRRVENVRGGASFPELIERLLTIDADGRWREAPDEGQGTATSATFVLREGDVLTPLDVERCSRRSSSGEALYLREPGAFTKPGAPAVSGYLLERASAVPVVGAVRQALAVVAPEDPAISEGPAVVVTQQGERTWVGVRWPLELLLARKWVPRDVAPLDDVEILAHTLSLLPAVFKKLKLKADGPLRTWTTGDVWLGQEVSAVPPAFPAGLGLATLPNGAHFVGASLLLSPGVACTPTPGRPRHPLDASRLFPGVATPAFLTHLRAATKGLTAPGAVLGVAVVT